MEIHKYHTPSLTTKPGDSMFRSEERIRRAVSKMLAQFYASNAFIADLKEFDEVGILMPDDHEAAVIRVLDKMRHDCSIIRWAAEPEGSDEGKYEASDIGKGTTARYAYYLIEYNIGIKSPDDVSSVMADAEKQLHDRKNLLRIYKHWSKSLMRDVYEDALAHSADRDEIYMEELVRRARKIKSFRSEATRIIRK